MTDPRSLLLIAGPLGLSEDDATRGDLAGAGAIAAIAAAPIAEVQLWARGGTAIDGRLQDLLTRRRIDCGGVAFTGETPRVRAGIAAPPPFLPEMKPVTADGVGAALVVGLSGGELARAVRTIKALPRGETRPLIVADAAVAADDVRALADVWIERAPATPPGGDWLALARSRQGVGDSGPKCVLLTADLAGGLIVYGQKATTYGSLPEPADARAGTGAGATFAGVLAAWLAGKGKADFSAIKRAAMLASAVAGTARLGPPARKLLSLGAKEYHERFNKLRRIAKA